MLPSKYRFLQQASSAGISIPSTLFLSFDDLSSGAFENLLNKFINQNRNDFYIVRSCCEGEDGNEKSFAGHFESSGRVKPEQLLETVKIYFKKNRAIQKKITPMGKVHLMVQPYLEADLGGVMFSKWKYFSHHFVGEASIGGAQAAVEGAGSDFFLLSKDESFEDLIVPSTLPKEALKETVKKCEVLFGFPLDIEWVAKDEVVTIVQIRPATAPVQALQIATSSEAEAQWQHLNKTMVGDWCVDSYAESFGILSPLSFSVLNHCFKAAIPTFKDLGFRAEVPNFLARSHNGQVYANVAAQNNFFKLKAWNSAFWQTVNERNFKKKVETFSKNYQASINFDLNHLNQVFNHWQIANFYAQKSMRIECLTWPQEYEVSAFLDLDYPTLKKEMTWPEWRNFYKQWWLFEFNKLKAQIVKNPIQAFASVKSLPFEKGDLEGFSSSNLEEIYKAELPLSVIDFPSVFSNVISPGKGVAVVKGDLNKVPVFVVKSPKTWQGEFPEKCVLVAPYFDNFWVLEIDKFAGIVLEQGGQLSHSAIVAREKRIPYYIHWAGATEEFKTGQKIKL